MTTSPSQPQTKVVEQNTTMATWAGAIARALAEQGVEARLLFDQAGIDYGLVNRPDKRIPVEAMTQLWQLAVRASGDSAFGLSVARQVNMTTFHALGVAAMASDTVRDATDMIRRFASMVSDGIDMQVRLEPEEPALIMAMRPGYPRFADACVEAVFASIVLTAYQLAPSLKLSRVTFQHRCSGDLLRYRDLFRCAVQFAAPEDGLFGSADLLPDAPLPASSPSVAEANAALCEEYLASRSQGKVCQKVTELIGQGLRQGQLMSLSKVASELAMSERKLQRLLREEEVLFRDLLDEVRAKLARQLLVNENQPAGRVAEQLGFDSPSAFSRAFRRWYGMSARDLKQAAREAEAENGKS